MTCHLCGSTTGDGCYWCFNSVTPEEIAGTFLLASRYPREQVQAVADELRAAGRDPLNAAIILRRREHSTDTRPLSFPRSAS